VGSVVLVSGREVEKSELSRFYGLLSTRVVDVLSVILVVGGVRLLLPPPPLLRARGYVLLLVCVGD